MENDFLNAVEYSHFLLKQSVDKNDYVVDATVGNGHDSKFLAELVGEEGKVYAFDIQQEAIDKSRELLKNNNLLSRTELLLDSHANLDKYVNSEISAVIFNLGYLPGGDKGIITESESTINAVKKSLENLKQKGIVILVVYSGHSGGEKEKKALKDYCLKLDYKKYNVLNYKFLNQPGPPPEILAIKKRK